MNRLLNTAEAAKFLGMSQAFLERDRWRGAEIPFCQLGRSVRYRVGDLNAYIESKLRRSTSDDGASDDSTNRRKADE